METGATKGARVDQLAGQINADATSSEPAGQLALCGESFQIEAAMCGLDLLEGAAGVIPINLSAAFLAGNWQRAAWHLARIDATRDPDQVAQHFAALDSLHVAGCAESRPDDPDRLSVTPWVSHRFFGRFE